MSVMLPVMSLSLALLDFLGCNFIHKLLSHIVYIMTSQLVWCQPQAHLLLLLLPSSYIIYCQWRWEGSLEQSRFFQISKLNQCIHDIELNLLTYKVLYNKICIMFALRMVGTISWGMPVKRWFWEKVILIAPPPSKEE